MSEQLHLADHAVELATQIASGAEIEATVERTELALTGSPTRESIRTSPTNRRS